MKVFRVRGFQAIGFSFDGLGPRGVLSDLNVG